MSDQTDRGLGCLLGLAIGDAVGTTLEFMARDTYPPLDDMIGGGPFHLRAGEWTDDTSMALCLADSLIACGYLDPKDLMDRFVRWYRSGENSVNGRLFDIGNATRAALERYLRTGNPEAGSTDPRNAGNGSIMRLAPVALRFHTDHDTMIAAARAQSTTTHASAATVEACALLSEILADAITSGDKNVALRRRHADDDHIDAIAQGSWRNKERDEIKSSGYVVDTLEAALWAIDRSADFRTAVLLAANLGGDTDTVAGVTGQIAGALFGKSGMPAEWLERLAWRETIEDRARRLLAAGAAS